MSGENGVVFDMATWRRKMERNTKELYMYAHGVLIDSQDELKEKIKAKAPRGATHKLVDNVFVKVVDTAHGPELKCGVKGGRFGAPYAVYQEFGTEKMEAHPFLRPALAEMPGFIKERARKRKPT